LKSEEFEFYFWIFSFFFYTPYIFAILILKDQRGPRQIKDTRSNRYHIDIAISVCERDRQPIRERRNKDRGCVAMWDSCDESECSELTSIRTIDFIKPEMFEPTEQGKVSVFPGCGHRARSCRRTMRRSGKIRSRCRDCRRDDIRGMHPPTCISWRVSREIQQSEIIAGLSEQWHSINRVKASAMIYIKDALSFRVFRFG